jgi:F0F1-type ATP synthase assembly protein I
MGSIPTRDKGPVPPRAASPWTWLAKHLSLALTLPASVFAGYLLGTGADHFLHVPVLRVAGILLGVFAGIYQVIRELNREQ